MIIVLGVVVLFFFMWKLLLFSALWGIRSFDADLNQELFALIIGYLGDRSTVKPMILALRDTSDVNELDRNLLRLHNRYPLDQEPYLSIIVDSILDKNTAHFNRVQLIYVLEKVTGETFGYPMIGYDEVPPELEPEIKQGLQNVKSWWEKRNKI